jgi:hypothetical protein
MPLLDLAKNRQFLRLGGKRYFKLDTLLNTMIDHFCGCTYSSTKINVTCSVGVSTAQGILALKCTSNGDS